MLSQGSLFDQVVGWAGIVGTALAVAVVAVGICISSVAYQVLALTARRRRWIGQAVREARLSTSRARFVRTSRRLLSSRVWTGGGLPRDELIWLTDLGPTTQTEDGLPGLPPVPVPFTFASRFASAGYSLALIRLSEAYDAYAVSLRRRWLLRSAAGPLVSDEYECARATARLLKRWASFEPMPAAADPDQMRGRLIELLPGTGPRYVRLVTWPDLTTTRAAPLFPAVSISYQPYRVAIAGSPSAVLDAEPRQIREVPDVSGVASFDRLSFDGVLPRWHGPGFRLEVDRITGRQKLHLCLAETTYLAFRATHDPSLLSKVGAAALSARVLSLSLLAMDHDDVVVLIQRSRYVGNPGRYSGTVTGNCELSSREGVQADLDHNGLPDPLGALIREAREELGIDLTGPGHQLAALGVIEYTGETEAGVRALVATARLPMPASAFSIARTDPDVVEGLWELGDQVMTIDLRATFNDATHGRRLVAWLRSAHELTPQATGALLLLLTATLELRQQQARRSGQNGRPAGAPPPWTTRDLAEWLSQPRPHKPPHPADLVAYHPLWR